MGLKERESKRKQSIVSSMISDSTESKNYKVENKDIYIVPKAKVETRSKRINLLIAPSVYVKAQDKCQKMGISLNECVNQFLNNWTQT